MGTADWRDILDLHEFEWYDDKAFSGPSTTARQYRQRLVHLLLSTPAQICLPPKIIRGTA